MLVYCYVRKNPKLFSHIFVLFTTDVLHPNTSSGLRCNDMIANYDIAILSSKINCSFPIVMFFQNLWHLWFFSWFYLFTMNDCSLLSGYGQTCLIIIENIVIFLMVIIPNISNNVFISFYNKYLGINFSKRFSKRDCS